MKAPGAFPEKTIAGYFLPWINAINSRECISVLNMPKRDQLYRVNELSKRQSFIEKTQFIILDLKGQIIEDAFDLESYLNRHVRINYERIALLILDADQLLDEKTALLSCLDKLYFDRKNFSLIYLFQKNITASTIIKKLSIYTSFFQNISVFSYFNSDEMEHFVKFLSTSFNVKIPEELKFQVIRKCGGSPWLIKEAVRYYSQTQDENNIFKHDSMKLKLKILYQELSSEERMVLDKIIKNEDDFSPNENETINYLLKTKLLIKNKKYLEISIPVLKDFIRETINSKTQLNLSNSGQLLLNGVIIEGFFSRREKRIIKLFTESKRKVVNREKIASIVWLNNKDDIYTDWALDQLIRRLRNKFVKLGLSRELIKTIKNQGYLFNGQIC